MTELSQFVKGLQEKFSGQSGQATPQKQEATSLKKKGLLGRYSEPEVILVQIYLTGSIPGLRQIESSEGEKVSQKRGVEIIKREEKLFPAPTILAILEASYVYTDGHWYYDWQGKPVNVLVFSRRPVAEVAEAETPVTEAMPSAVQEVLMGYRFNNGSVYLNETTGQDGKVRRLDSIVLFVGAKPGKKNPWRRSLVVVQEKGRMTYKVEDLTRPEEPEEEEVTTATSTETGTQTDIPAPLFG